MSSARPGTRPRARGGLVTLGTVVVLLAAMAVTLFGSGAADNALAGYDASAWLWSSPRSEMARVNGLTGRVDTRYRVTDAQGHTMQVSQNDRHVILRDPVTGKISVLDLATLQVAAATDTTPGVGVSVAVHRDVAMIVDAVQGLVRQLDPATLAPIGEPLRFPAGLAGGTFDDTGRLWLLVPREGTVVAVTPAAPAPASAARTGGTGGAAAGSPQVAHTVAVAEPSHDLALTVLDGGAAVLDKTAATLTTVRGATTRTVKLPQPGAGVMPARTAGDNVPVTVTDDRRVYVISGDRVADFTVPGDSPRLAPCVAWAGRAYCPDEATGTVHVLDLDGRQVASITLPNSGGRLELEVRERHLFINAPNAPTARVVNDRHRVSAVDKYTNNIVGGDPPANPPPPPPSRPTVSVPGAPARVVAVAGNAQVRVTWGPAPANGARILRYVVEGGGRSVDVGADQRSLNVTGLTNGTEYRFTVHAVNGKGAGPKRAANPVVPSADVPDPPTSVTATARPDGTVAVTWPAANGQGRRIVRYDVTTIAAGGQRPAGETGATTLVIPAGQLTYGTQYAFTVVAVNDRGVSSRSSPTSNTVVPYARPGPPRNVRAATVNRRGTIDVSWQPADANGRAIERYVVAAGKQRHDVRGTSVTLTGLGDGVSIPVSVRAVNAAGEGPAVQRTATTIDRPRLTVTGTAGGLNSITVNVAVNDGGSPTRCTFAVAGGGSASGNCASLTAGGLWPGRSYSWTVTATNAVGTASQPGSTSTRALAGTVLCGDPSYCGPGAPNGGIWVYRQPTQTGTAIGDVFAPSRHEAVCQTADARGATVDATPWGGKRSAMWVRIRYPTGQENYIPFAWLRLDEGDNLSLLPRC